MEDEKLIETVKIVQQKCSEHDKDILELKFKISEQEKSILEIRLKNLELVKVIEYFQKNKTEGGKEEKDKLQEWTFDPSVMADKKFTLNNNNKTIERINEGGWKGVLGSSPVTRFKLLIMEKGSAKFMIGFGPKSSFKPEERNWGKNGGYYLFVANGDVHSNSIVDGKVYFRSFRIQDGDEIIAEHDKEKKLISFAHFDAAYIKLGNKHFDITHSPGVAFSNVDCGEDLYPVFEFNGKGKIQILQ